MLSLWRRCGRRRAWSAGLTLAGALLLRWSRLPWLAVLGTLLCPAALWNYECGQISLLITDCAEGLRVGRAGLVGPFPPIESEIIAAVHRRHEGIQHFARIPKGRCS